MVSYKKARKEKRARLTRKSKLRIMGKIELMNRRLTCIGANLCFISMKPLVEGAVTVKHAFLGSVDVNPEFKPA